MVIIDNIKLKRLRDFINDKFGVFIDDDKLDSIYKRKFINLMQQFGYKDFSQFYRDVVFTKDTRLIQELANTITVNETYFFRESYQFETLVNHLLPELHSKKPSNESINILSAPCSTGEETYSIAIYILEEGNIINQRDIMILGIDIDSSAIEKAKRGIFSSRSVHKIPPHILMKYFKKEQNYYVIDESLRNAITFKVVNVLDKYQIKKLGTFDVIFSRNMLIYFDEKNRKEALTNFYTILNDGGYLLLGHAEKIPSNLGLFRPIKIGNSFIYKKV